MHHSSTSLHSLPGCAFSLSPKVPFTKSFSVKWAPPSPKAGSFCPVYPKVFCALGGKRRRHSANTSRRNGSTPRPAATALTAEERLQKVMSRLGVASRRKSEVIISEGRVRVNGKVVKELGCIVNARKDRIVIDGRELDTNVPALWIAVHKPRGYLGVPKEGAKGTILDFVPKGKRKFLTSVGGLDADFSGLVLLTNETGHIPRLASPDNRHVKEWIVDCYGSVKPDVLLPLTQGVHLEGDSNKLPTLPVNIKIEGTEKVEVRPREFKMLTRIQVTARESRYRHIRRLFEAVGLEVHTARRRRFGPVLLGSLRRGDFRYLTEKEIKALKRGVSEKRTQSMKHAK